MSEITPQKLREPTGNRYRLLTLLCACEKGKGALKDFITRSHIEARHVSWFVRNGLAEKMTAGPFTVVIATGKARALLAEIEKAS